MEGDDELMEAVTVLLDNIEYSCYGCAHLNKDKISCKAFPEVIPNPLLTGQVRHTKRLFKQDNDIFFEKA